MPADTAQWGLFLDVDGTLLDFVDDPRKVEVSAALLETLHGLHEVLQGALALVSGRDLDDLDRLFGNTRWAAAGLHGLQLRRADGSFRRITVTEEQQAYMHRVTTALAAQFPDVQVEDKGIAVALHCRRAPSQFEPLSDAAKKVMTQISGYELQPGNWVIEFKPAGMDKGRAVMELLASAQFDGHTPVYLGDDLTDEHAFGSVVRRHGMGVIIGRRRPTLARFALPDPAATHAWLAEVLDTLRQRR